MSASFEQGQSITPRDDVDLSFVAEAISSVSGGVLYVDYENGGSKVPLFLQPGTPQMTRITKVWATHLRDHEGYKRASGLTGFALVLDAGTAAAVDAAVSVERNERILQDQQTQTALEDLAFVVNPGEDSADNQMTKVAAGIRQLIVTKPSRPQDFGWTGTDDTADEMALVNWAISPIFEKVLDMDYPTPIKLGLVLTEHCRVSGVGSLKINAPNTVKGVSQQGSLTDLGVCNGVKGSQILNVVASATLVVGDYVTIYNHADYSHDGHRDYHRAGQHTRVVEIIDSTTIRVAGYLHTDYAVPDPVTGPAVKLYKMNMASLIWDGPAIVTNTGFCCLFTDVSLVKIKKGTFVGGYYNSLSVGRTISPRINATAICNEAAAGTQYGLSLNGVLDARVEGTYYGTRHGITTGGADGPGWSTNRNTYVSATISSDAIIGLPSADDHPNAEYTTWDNCDVFGGVDFSGLHTTVMNSKISTKEGFPAISLAGCLGGAVKMLNTDIFLNNVNHARLLDGGVVGSYLTPLMTEPLHITLKGLNVYCGPGHAALTTGYIWMRQRGVTKRTVIDIDDINFHGAAGAAFLWATVVGDAPVDTPEINIRNVRRFDGGSFDTSLLTDGWAGAAGTRDF